MAPGVICLPPWQTRFVEFEFFEFKEDSRVEFKKQTWHCDRNLRAFTIKKIIFFHYCMKPVLYPTVITVDIKAGIQIIKMEI